ncbi:MAG: hypothetical protein JJD92_10260 [Frankiaceae bacterium]|nr:hypothetical protein [Frankiaceae bacterium]
MSRSRPVLALLAVGAFAATSVGAATQAADPSAKRTPAAHAADKTAVYEPYGPMPAAPTSATAPSRRSRG